MGHADARTLPGRIRQQRVLARLWQHHAVGPGRGDADHGARWDRGLHFDSDPVARPPVDRCDRLVAVDDARHRPRSRFPLGLCAATACDSHLWNDLGAAFGLYLAWDAAVGARDVERVCTIILRSGGMFARARRKLAADDVA